MDALLAYGCGRLFLGWGVEEEGDVMSQDTD